MPHPPSLPSRLCAFCALALATTFVLTGRVCAAENETLEQTLAKYLELRAQLDTELTQLDAEHANDSVERWRDVVRAWHERNAARFAAQAQRAAILQKAVEASTPEPAPLPPLATDLPADVREFLTEARWADAELQTLAARWKNATPEQRRDAARAWHEQHATRLAAQKARAELIGERVEAHIASEPFITLIPSDASPQFREVLLLQADLDDGLAAVTDSLKGAAPERLRDAVRDWHDGHQAEFKELRRLRENLIEHVPGS